MILVERFNAVKSGFGWRKGSNFKGLVLFCIEAEFCNQVLILLKTFFKNCPVAFGGISDQNLRSWGAYAGPGGPWDQFPPSSTQNGGPGNELSPKNQQMLTTIGLTSIKL